VKIVETDKLNEMAAALAAKGYRVVAPVRDGDVVRLKEWKQGDEIALDAFTVNSVKDVLIPASEVIGRYALDGDDFTPEAVAAEAPKTVVLAARPCDAAAPAVLDAVFNWDYADAFYNARRAATTIAALACRQADEQCFCTSVGGAPNSTAGADVILRPADGGKRLTVEALSEKGEALVAAAGEAIKEGEAVADAVAEVPVRFDAAALTARLAENFESPLWQTLSLACLGCGACAYACPTCHCFDIQDEGTRRESVRLRNWDSCGFGLFTQHAGGHNPRPDQAARWRQRVMHKFLYFVERFGRLACSGCGRCARLCPAGMAMADSCAAIEAAAQKAAKR